MKKISVLDLPLETRTKLLASKTDCKEIRFAGETRLFFLGGVSLEIAEEQGVDLGEVLQVVAAANVSEDDLGSVDKYNTALAWLLWTGFAIFDTELTPAEIKLRLATLTSEEAKEVFSAVEMQGVEDALDEEEEADLGKPQE